MVSTNGLVGLLEKRLNVYSPLGISDAATFIGDFNHPAQNTLLLDSETEVHNNHGSDPATDSISLSDVLAFNMIRVRASEHSLGFSDHVHATLDGYHPDLGRNDMTANETILIGQPVYVSANNTVNLGDATTIATANVIGLALTGATANDSLAVLTEGSVSQADWTAVVGATLLTPGATYFLNTAAGQMSTIPPTSDGEVVVTMGTALTTTKFDIEVNEIATL
jgi:hypothetical protein